VGLNTNNLVELMAFHVSLLLALEKGVKNLPVFGGDSLLVIKWVKKEIVLINYLLQPMLGEVFDIIQDFDHTSFQHV
jgi:hypothetical protein